MPGGTGRGGVDLVSGGHQTPRGTPLEILVDSRELRPYRFSGAKGIAVRVTTLSTGDYSISGLENRVSIERKSLSDAYGTIGRGRERFVRELDRLAAIHAHPDGGYAAILVEADLRTFFERPPRYTKLHPRSAIGSVLAWSVRYGIPVWFAGSRRYGEAVTRKLLESFWVSHQMGTRLPNRR